MGLTTKSFNQATYYILSNNLIIMNIQTKRARGNSKDVNMKLWTAAQFSRLKRLVKEAGHAETQMLILPLIVAHGATWHPCGHTAFSFQQQCLYCNFLRVEKRPRIP